MPHLLEVAPTGRAKCRGCSSTIAKGELRFGERLPNPFADDGGEMTHWFHLWCAAFRRPEVFLDMARTTDIALPDRDAMVREAELGVKFRRVPRVSTVERASTGRAVCRHCKELIPKDTWRISLVYYEDGRFSASGFAHVGCAKDYFETTEIMPRVKRFSPALSESDLADVAGGL
jgi:hypothetical protein